VVPPVLGAQEALTAKEEVPNSEPVNEPVNEPVDEPPLEFPGGP
jgi:hypothetical protein